MAVYKLFPEKDATIFSEFPTMNSGISEILSLSKIVSLNFPSYSAVGRVLIKFADADLSSSVANYIYSNPFSANLRLFLADACNIPLDYTLKVHAVSGSWDMGTGRIDNIPITTNGVSWRNRTASPYSAWQSQSYDQNVTGSYFPNNPGGGVWHNGLSASQSFNHRTTLDTNFDVTSIVQQHVSGTISNDGFILKIESPVEFDSNYQYDLNYFSVDTNTIYPPCLELKWDDSVFTPNTASMSVITTNAVVTVGNNAGLYNPNSIVRFTVNARDQFPPRMFVTSSLFTINKYLPDTSFYSVRDLDTDNIIVDFDDDYTKISTDQNGSFFNLYMNGLEPERYYKLQIKTEIGGNVNIYDNHYYFKVSKK